MMNYNNEFLQTSGRMNGEKKKMTPLSSYTPGPFDVICAKGSLARNHTGNIRFRQMVDQLSTHYGNVTNRTQKTKLVNQVIDFVRSANGAFVKFEDGQWNEIGDAMAREKVGQSLREKNHNMYRSSTKAKRKLRKDMNQRMVDRITTVVNNNDAIATGLHKLSACLEKHSKQLLESDAESSSDESDAELEIAMTSANSQILASLKNDETLQSMLHEDKSQNKMQ